MNRNLLILLASASAVPALAQPAPQPVPIPAPYDARTANQPDSEDDIVIVGQRQLATVIGDIPPENQLTSRDIRATGATSITELLAAIAPQIGSARGRGTGQPVLLLNGQRISSFRELRDIPPEAIERVDILPEEVALKYGYRADQKIVNFVLRRRFNSTAIRADAGGATDGGYLSGLGDATRFTIAGDTRTTINLHTEANDALNENERDIVLTPGQIDQRGFRSLVGERRLVRGNVTATRTVLGNVGATLNAELEHSDGKSGLGFNAIPLLRDTQSDSGHLGVSLNGAKGKWRWSATGNGDVLHISTDSDRSASQTDAARSTRTALGVDATASGPLFKLPAGDASATFKIAADTLVLDASNPRLGRSFSTSLSRGRGDVSANLDLPILKNSPVGKLTANANAELEHLSDFGTLTTYGAGLNWTVLKRLDLIASWTREEGAPTIEQLGNPLIETLNARVFDFTTGQSVNVTAVSGGNPGLDADRRSVVKFGANFQPFEKIDLRLRADYVRQIIDRPISDLPGPSAALEAAFPNRFVRDGGGNLISVDLRSVNFDQSRRETFRWGFDFSKPLKSARPSPAMIEQFRARFAPPGGAPPGQSGADRPRGEGGGRGFGGGGFGGANRGRVQLSLTDTITLVDQATIRAGLPRLDYLNGDASGQAGGTPRHKVELQTGYSNNGLGARLSGNWRSGTRVEGGPNGDLKFSPLTTVDARFFINFGERFDLVAKHPWLIGSSVRFEVNNLFNARPNVRDGLGAVPLSYQSDLLDPTGRTVTISFRKLFLPQRFRARANAASTTR